LAHSSYPLLVIIVIPFDDSPLLSWLLILLRERSGGHLLVRWLPHIWGEGCFIMPIGFRFHLDELSILVMDEVYVDGLVDIVLVDVCLNSLNR
jgi:hypothetical protein